MIVSIYQKVVIVSELQEIKRLKQSPHSYKFSHSWLYRHNMQEMRSVQGFLLAPSATPEFHTLYPPQTQDLLCSPLKQVSSPDSLLASSFPPGVISSNKQILAYRLLEAHPTKPFVLLVFSHLSFDKFILSELAMTWKSAQSSVNKRHWHAGLDSPYTAVTGSHTLLGTLQTSP